MVGLLAPALIAAAVGLSLGGSLDRLTCRWWPAILLAFGVELVLYNPPVDGTGWAMSLGPSVWVAARVVILIVMVVNAMDRWPWWIAATGVALNTLVVGANGGHMPQSTDAAIAVWGASQMDPTRLQNVVPIGADTILPWFGDVIAEPRWLPRPNVISVGDVLLALGVAAWLFTGTTQSNGFVSIGKRTVKIRSWVASPIDGAARPRRRNSL